MKSRTSFFNATVFKKNITRFAPVWALYSIFLLMQLLSLAAETSAEFADNLVAHLQGFAGANFVYAPVCALLLFGDLYKSRMCNALHAMPLRRECWFSTNVISGLLFSLIPNAVFTLICLLFVGELFAVPLLWLLGVSLQYTFFFGAAVLAVYCVGNGFAMVLVYLIINLFFGIVYALVELLYIPIMHGVWISGYMFEVFIPLVLMTTGNSYAHVEIIAGTDAARLQIQEGWVYLAVCAAVGIGYLALARFLYRRRHLETAGDFLAVRRLRPVFLVLYTVTAVTCFATFTELFWLEGASIILLPLGIAVGVYTGHMLLERTVRVFRKKTFLMFIAILGVMIFSLAVVGFDLLGIVRWVPKTSDIASVKISTDGLYGTRQTITTPEEVADVLMMHRHGIDNRNPAYGEKQVEEFSIEYTLKNGAIVYREYDIEADTVAGQCLKKYASSPTAVLGQIYIENRTVKLIEIPDAERIIEDKQAIRQLMDAILADCEEATLPQDWRIREDVEHQFHIELQCDVSEDRTIYHYIQVSSDARHVMDWLEQQGIDPENWEKFK